MAIKNIDEDVVTPEQAKTFFFRWLKKKNKKIWCVIVAAILVFVAIVMALEFAANWKTVFPSVSEPLLTSTDDHEVNPSTSEPLLASTDDHEVKGHEKRVYTNIGIYAGEWHVVEGINESNKKWIYYGELNQGSVAGLGVSVFDDGYIFIGYESKEKSNWGAELNKTSENIYVGQFQQGKRTGKGIELSDNSWLIFVGDWIQGKKDGFGITCYRSQFDTVKQGIWRDNMYTKLDHTGPYGWDFDLGDGESTYWCVFVGNGIGFSESRGSYNPETDQFYMGEMDGNNANGFGCYKLKSGDYYIGEFQGSQQHGKGVMLNQDGSMFIGEWKFGLRTINGILIDTNGEVSTPS